MRMNKHLAYLLVGVWFCVTTVLVLAMTSNVTKAFDHDMRLSMQLMSLDFEAEFVQNLRSHSAAKTNTLFHITSDDTCFCQNLAKSHIAKLNMIVDGSDFDIRTLNISEFSTLKQSIPSTPAVVVVNENDELLYLGPYSRGSGCFGNNGEINAILENAVNMPKNATQEQTDMPQSASIIVHEARGCYCNDSA